MTIDAQASRAGPRAGETGGEPSLYDLGVSYSTGTAGRPLDLIEAHVWFNLAACGGSARAAAARAEIAGVMSRGEIAAAQRRARLWLDTPDGAAGALAAARGAAGEKSAAALAGARGGAR